MSTETTTSILLFLISVPATVPSFSSEVKLHLCDDADDADDDDANGITNSPTFFLGDVC